MAMTPEDSEKVQKLIDKSFLEYDDRTKALVNLAYEKAKSETVELLRQENGVSFRMIEQAAAAKIKQMDDKMETDTLVVDARLAHIEEGEKNKADKFNHLNAEQLKAQEEMTKLYAALESARNEFERMREAGTNLENTSKGLEILDMNIRTYMDTQHAKLAEQFVECAKKVDAIVEDAKLDITTAHEPRPTRGLVDMKDLKIEKMPENMTIEVFRKWKHDVEKYIENIPAWKRGSRLL